MGTAAMTGCDAVAAWCAATGTTETELARRVGVSRQALYWVRSASKARRYSPEMALAIHAETGIPLETLLRGKAA